MLSSIIDAFKVPELRKKILFTLAILALYRFGAYVPVPGIPFNEFANSFQDSGVSMTMLDLFTGGALSNFSDVYKRQKKDIARIQTEMRARELSA